MHACVHVFVFIMKCSICDSEKLNYDDFIAHVIDNHRNDENLRILCPTCFHPNVSIKALQTHVKRNHPPVQNSAALQPPFSFRCELCNQTSNNIDNNN